MLKKKLDLERFYSSQGFALACKDFEKKDRLKKMVSIIAEEAEKKGGRIKILDIGCGDGAFIGYIAHMFPQAELSGCDVADSIISDNKRSEALKGFDFFVHDFNKPFAIENAYDVIVAGELVEHLENTDNFFQETNKALRPGGILIVTTPNLASWLDRLMLLVGWQPFSTEVAYANRVFGRKTFYRIFGVTDSMAVGHLRIFTPGALRDVGEYYGLRRTLHLPYYNQERFLNIVISKMFKNLAEGMIMVFKREG